MAQRRRRNENWVADLVGRDRANTRGWARLMAANRRSPIRPVFVPGPFKGLRAGRSRVTSWDIVRLTPRKALAGPVKSRFFANYLLCKNIGRRSRWRWAFRR